MKYLKSTDPYNNKQAEGEMESFLQQKIRGKVHLQGRAFCDVLDNSNNNKGHESSAILKRDVACSDKWPLLRLRSGTSDNGHGTAVFIFGMCQTTCFWSLLFCNSQVFIYMGGSSRASPVKRSWCIWTVRTFPSPLCWWHEILDRKIDGDICYLRLYSCQKGWFHPLLLCWKFSCKYWWCKIWFWEDIPYYKISWWISGYRIYQTICKIIRSAFFTLCVNPYLKKPIGNLTGGLNLWSKCALKN